MPHRQHRSSTNTNRRPLMSASYSLPPEPEGMVAKLLERFNSGKVAAMMSLYAPEAVLIAKDGRTITDHTKIAAELERDLKLGLPLEAKARHVFVADNIAQIVMDWSIDGTGPDGKHVHIGGSASDILRRGVDGLWRYPQLRVLFPLSSRSETAILHCVCHERTSDSAANSNNEIATLHGCFRVRRKNTLPPGEFCAALCITAICPLDFRSGSCTVLETSLHRFENAS